MNPADRIPLARVDWIDSTSEDEWCDDDGRDLKPMTVVSVGILLVDNDERILLARSICDGGPEGRLVIPRCCVRRVVVFPTDGPQEEEE